MTVGTPEYFPDGGPIAIRDATVARLQTMTGFNKVFPSRTLPTKPEHLPAACVWHAGDRTEPWGDADVSVPSFVHKLTIAVDIVTSAPSEAALDSLTVPLTESVKATLLTDPSWMALVEACERVDTRYSYPKEADTFLCVATIELEVTFRSAWVPVVANDLLEVAVTATNLPGAPQLLDVTFEALS